MSEPGGDSRRSARRERTAPTAPAADDRGSRSARWRVAIRLAHRQVRRTRASSLLVMLLVALPIAGMTGVAVYVDSTVATSQEAVRVELGATEAWIAPGGIPDAGFWQNPTDPYYTGYPTDADGVSTIPDREPRTDIDGVLPAGTATIPISQDDVSIQTVGGVAAVPSWGGEVWNEALQPTFALVDGRAPRSSDEVLVSAATLERTGQDIGGTLTTPNDGRQYTIVGEFTAATLRSDASAVVFAEADTAGTVRWYLPDLALSWADVQKLNDAGVVAYSREVVLDPPPFEVDGYAPADARTSMLWSLIVSLAIGGAFAAYMVVMLAGAAFAVSARRQQRALAIAASVGADARDIRRTITMQGCVLGTIGGVVGVAGGVGLAAAVMALTANGSATQYWGFHVPWLLLAGILVFAILVGTLSALVPARSVARTDTISALRGARRPQAVRASRPLWGSLMIAVGIALTVVSGIAAAAVAGNTELAWDSPLRWIPVVGIIAGPVLAQIGIVISGRWLLWLASLGLSRVGVAARMASRDAVANGARTVPAFAAIGATVFIGVFAVAVGTMSAAQSARNYIYASPVGTASLTVYPSGTAKNMMLAPDAAAEAIAFGRDALTEAGVTRIGAIDRQPDVWTEDPRDIPDDLLRAVAVTPDRSLLDPDGMGFSGSQFSSPENNIVVVPPGDVETVTGVTLTAAQRSAYASGTALVFTDSLVTDGMIEVAAWRERDWRTAEVPSNIFRAAPGETFEDPVWSSRVDAIEIDAPGQSMGVLLAPETARTLGIAVQPYGLVGEFPEMPTQTERDRVNEIYLLAPSDDFSLSGWVEMGPADASAWLVPLLAAVSVLVLGASAVALGLARFERRPDDATLSAVGGTTRLRRGIGFWQGLVIAGFGTFAGAAAGILPPIGFQLQSQGQVMTGSLPMQLSDVPWWLVVALSVALPLVIAVANWIVPPRRPDLTRRTAIA